MYENKKIAQDLRKAIQQSVILFFLIYPLLGCSPKIESIGVSTSQIQLHFESMPWNFQFVDGALTDDQGRPRLVGSTDGILDLAAPGAIEIIRAPGNDEEVLAVVLTLFEVPPPYEFTTVGTALTYLYPALELARLVTPDWDSFESEFTQAFSKVFISSAAEAQQSTIEHGDLRYEMVKDEASQIIYLAIQHK